MKLTYIGEAILMLTPLEKKIRPGDVIEDASLVKLLRGHPLFMEEPEPVAEPIWDFEEGDA